MVLFALVTDLLFKLRYCNLIVLIQVHASCKTAFKDPEQQFAPFLILLLCSVSLDFYLGMKRKCCRWSGCEESTFCFADQRSNNAGIVVAMWGQTHQM